MSVLKLNHILNDKADMPRTYWLARRDGGGAYLMVGKLRIPEAYAGKRLRLRVEVDVLG